MRISEVARKWGEGGPEVAWTEQARRPHLQARWTVGFPPLLFEHRSIDWWSKLTLSK